MTYQGSRNRILPTIPLMQGEGDPRHTTWCIEETHRRHVENAANVAVGAIKLFLRADNALKPDEYVQATEIQRILYFMTKVHELRKNIPAAAPQTKSY